LFINSIDNPKQQQEHQHQQHVELADKFHKHRIFTKDGRTDAKTPDLADFPFVCKKIKTILNPVLKYSIKLDDKRDRCRDLTFYLESMS
jgi:hypothetical protein